jgi:hypothetical protein
MRSKFEQFALVIGLEHLEHTRDCLLNGTQTDHGMKLLVRLALLHDQSRIRANEVFLCEKEIIRPCSFRTFLTQPASLSFVNPIEEVLQSPGIAKAVAPTPTAQSTNSNSSCKSSLACAGHYYR